MPKTSQVYVLLFTLYWAQGLPVGFITQALPIIFRAEGLSLAQIGGLGLLMLPWSIKVFWAPVVDRFGSRRFGHYRSWIIPMQCLSAVGLVILSFMPIAALNEPLYLLMLFGLIFAMNMVVATQDVATDGLAVHVLKTGQLGWGNSLQVLGSRLGFIVGGGVTLWALDALTWQHTFLLLAVLVLLNSLPILYHRETTAKPQTAVQSVPFITQIKAYFSYFTTTPELITWLGVLLSFKIADGLAGPILKPLLVDLGLSYSQIGLYITMLGAFAALVGALLAGYSLRWWTVSQALMLYSLMKVMSLAAFAVLAWKYSQDQVIAPFWIYLANAFEDMISAMLLVVMLSLIMSYSRKTFASTDFTFQVALMATVSGILYTFSGLIGDQLGYTTYLMSITAISLLCIVPIVVWAKNKKP